MPPHIEFKNISKRYRIGRSLPSLKSALSRHKNAKPVQYHWAVKDVSFDLHPGESLGIIGPNGAGKTTILKLLSKVTQPTSGEIIVNGRMSALIELGAGFHPDLTGRENVFLNGTILGMRRDEIHKRFDDIVDFAGIGDYLDTPVKRYSSGMYARLGFAIAAHVDPQILVVDEVLAVGDFAFQTKCYARMDELRRNGTSLIFVSHNMDAVRRVCDRGLVMYRGQPIYQGSAVEAVVAYSDAVRSAARAAQEKKDSKIPLEGGLSQRVMTFDAEIEQVTLLNERGQPVTVVESGAEVNVALDAKINKDVQHPIFAITIRTPEGYLVYNNTTDWMKIKTPVFHAGERCRVIFKIRMPLIEGVYDLGADIASPDLRYFYDRVENAMSFAMHSHSGAKGLVDLGAQVSFEEAPILRETA
jgi:ABC-type polysaccharide/polyol phosphate transport system ATPase subunit